MAAETTITLGKSWTLGYSTATGAGPYTYLAANSIKTVKLNISLDEVETTVLNSTFKTFLPTIPGGEVDFSYLYIPGDSGCQAFINSTLNGTTIHWQLLSAAGTKIQWDAFLKGYSPNFENGSPVESDGSMRLNAAPVVTQAP